MLAAAQYDRRVKFWRVTAARDAAGVETSTLALICEAYGKASYGSNADRRVAAGTEAGQTVTVRVRSTANLRTVKVTDRMELRGDAAVYSIEGVVPVGAGAGDIILTGLSAKGAGA
jgi:head-tail adaptor